MSDKLSIKETAEYLGISTKTVHRYIADGRLRAVRLGPRLIRVDASSVDDLMCPIGN